MVHGPQLQPAKHEYPLPFPDPISHSLKFPPVLGGLAAGSHIRLADDFRQGSTRPVEVDKGVRRAGKAFRSLVVHLRRVFLHMQPRYAHLVCCWVGLGWFGVDSGGVGLLLFVAWARSELLVRGWMDWLG